MLRASIAAENAGVRSVSLVASGFAGQARACAKAFGVPGIALAQYPGVIMTDDPDTFRAKVAGPVVEEIIAGLQARVSGVAHDVLAGPTDIVCSGTLDEVQEFFLGRQWSDGLPIMPPTVASVRRFLERTKRNAEDVLGVLLPGGREATVWTVAVNGVMAGCRPEYMPVLVAIVEAISDPAFRIQDAGSTPGWDPLVTLAGPAVRRLGFNSEGGVLRVGRQANTSVGRFLRLYMRNVAGLQIPPLGTDKATIGLGLNSVALAENLGATEGMGWTPHAVERGFAKDDSVVTVQSVSGITGPIYSAGTTAPEHLRIIAESLGSLCSHRVYGGLRRGAFHPFVVMSPAVARVVAADGYGKDDVRRYLQDNAQMDIALVFRHGRQSSGVDMHEYLRPENVPAEYLKESGTVSAIPWPERLGIIVAGDPERNQSRGFVNQHMQGAPVTRRVDVP